jgi:hypothetical protein
MNRVWPIIVICLAALALAGCCFPTGGEASAWLERIANRGSVQRETREVDAGDATRVVTTIQFGGGELEIQGGATKLMQGEFEFRPSQLEPTISYQVTDGEGELGIRQRWDTLRWDQLTGEPHNLWRIRFADSVPMRLVADVGASSGRLDLGGLPITDMRLNAGAADLSIAFEAPNPQQMRSLEIRTGAARLELLGLGNANTDELNFDGGLGDYVLDFQGEWQRSAQVHVKAGASQVLLVVPRDIGVRVCPGDLRGGEFGGLTQEGDCYVDDAYAEADITLDISLDMGLGKLDVKQAK